MEKKTKIAVILTLGIAISAAGILLMKPGKQVTLSLDSVYLDQKSINLDNNDKLTIQYKPSKSCRGSIYICDSSGVLVKNLVMDRKLPSRLNSAIWDGKDSRGSIVPSGIYFFIIELKTQNEQFTYNPYRKTHGISHKLATGSFDEENRVINYTVPQASCIRIRVGLKDGGPLLHTILDWQPKAAGKYSLPWDGMDSSGFINLANHPKRNMVIFAYSLADNSIIVESSTKRVSNCAGKQLFSTDLSMDRSIHARRSIELSKEPSFDVSFTGELKTSEDGVTPIVSGVLPVKITIAPEDRLKLENSRYELMFYVDAIFTFEEESGFSPFTYLWDTTKLGNGDHLLTVNLWSYNDTCGVATRKVNIKN